MIRQYALFYLMLLAFCTQIVSVGGFQQGSAKILRTIKFPSSSTCHFFNKCFNSGSYSYDDDDDGSSMNSMMLSSQRSKCNTITSTTSKSKLRASDTSSADFKDVVISKTRSLFHRSRSHSSCGGEETIVSAATTTRNVQRSIQRVFSSSAYLLNSISASFSTTMTSNNKPIHVFRQSWWILPMLLTLIPVYCAIIKGTCALMPDWWSVVNIDYLKRSKDATFVIGQFLFSNIAYFVSGIYLLQKFPFDENHTTTQQQSKKRNSRLSMLQLLPDLNIKNTKPTQYTMLGIWVLSSGLISTIFHSVQALGSFAVANALCYIDHAFALSSGLYFYKTCGMPSRKTLSIGLLSLVTLAVTYPGYAWLHSTWHYLSAITATKWAIEGYNNNNNESSAI